MPKQKINVAFIYIISIFILLSGALINRFPLVYPDSGTYIASGFQLEVPADRPIVYGLFIRVFSFGHSLWFVAIAQCILLSYLLIRCFQKFLSKSKVIWIIPVLTFLAYFTGVTWYSGQLVADVFTPISILTLLLLFLKRFSAMETVFLILIFLTAVMAHTSNLLSVTLLFSGLFVLLRFTGWFRETNISRNRWIFCAMMVFCPWVLLPAINYSLDGEFRISRATPIFIMGKLVENGILHEYLVEKCNEKNYKLCPFIDKLPCGASYFLWNENSPLAKTGGWEANYKEYLEIESDMLTSPKYIVRNIEESAFSTCIQLLDNGVGGLGKNLNNTTPYNAVKEYFPYEIEQYSCSLQNSDALQFHDLNKRQNILLIISTLVIFLFLIHPSVSIQSSNMKTFIAGVLLFCICNAAVCASLANSLDRLQGRTSWLLVFAALLIVLENGKSWLQALKSEVENNSAKNPE